MCRCLQSLQSHTITVRATSADGSHADTNFTIALSDVNEYPVGTPVDVLDTTANQVAENAGTGSAVGVQANASDPDGTTNTITYSFADGGDATPVPTPLQKLPYLIGKAPIVPQIM